MGLGVTPGHTQQRHTCLRFRTYSQDAIIAGRGVCTRSDVVFQPSNLFPHVTVVWDLTLTHPATGEGAQVRSVPPEA